MRTHDRSLTEEIFELGLDEEQVLQKEKRIRKVEGERVHNIKNFSFENIAVEDMEKHCSSIQDFHMYLVRIWVIVKE